MFRFIRQRVDMDTILLVDDNPLRASMRKTALGGSAPEVVRVQNAGEALCLVESPEFAENLTLVITGHTMSGISGPEFVAEVRNRMPEVPVLVLSAATNAEKEYREIPGVRVSEAASPDDLRILVQQMTRPVERRVG